MKNEEDTPKILITTKVLKSLHDFLLSKIIIKKKTRCTQLSVILYR